MGKKVLREERECWFCGGTGIHFGDACPSCEGTGVQDEIAIETDNEKEIM